MKAIEKNSDGYYLSRGSKAFDPTKFILKNLKYLPYILVSIILALAGAFIYNKTTPPIYQVSSKFFINEEGSNLSILDLTGQTRNPLVNQNTRISNEAIFLKSHPVAERVLDILDLNVDYYQPGTFSNKELYTDSPIRVLVDWEHPQLMGGLLEIKWVNQEEFTLSFPESEYVQYFPFGRPGEEVDAPNLRKNKFQFSSWIELPYAKFQVTLNDLKATEGNILINLRSRESLLSKYTGEDLQVWPLDPVSSVVGLTLNTSHPRKGADYLNAVMEIYLSKELDEKNYMAKNTVDFIDAQISGVSDSLSFVETKLQSYRSTNRTYNIQEESTSVFAEITDLEKQLGQERFKRQYFQNLQTYLQSENYENIISPSGIGIEDPILNTLIENLITLQSERYNLLTTQTEASPRVRDLSNKVQDVNRSLSEVLKNVVRNTEILINDLEGRINRIEQKFSRLPSTEQNLLKIQREYTFNEAIYTYLLQRRAEAAIAMASNTNSNKIVEYARPKYEPIKVKETIVYILAMVIGGMLPVMIIWTKSVLDKRIKDSKEIEEELAVPLIGKIAKNYTDTALPVLSAPRSAITETFRALKTNISFLVPQEKQLTIAVTSTLSGEGKTFTARNLASTYSLNNKKTILVSCDMFKSAVYKDFKLEKKNMGLANYLSQQQNEFQEIIQTTQYPNLDIITAGSIPPNPSEMLASERFIHLIEELKHKYEVIVLDTPPVGLISHAFEALKQVDIILYVLRYNFSETTFVNEVNEIKIKKRIKNIYAVINDLSNKELNFKTYNYGYYEANNPKRTFLKGIFTRNKAAL